MFTTCKPTKKYNNYHYLYIMKSILGIGNALTDIPVIVPGKEMLGELGLLSGTMNHIDLATERRIWENICGSNMQCIPGGSAANTVVAAVQLGMKGGFIGKVGKDATGRNFAGAMEKYGVEANLLEGTLPSGKAYTFIASDDGVRTFAAYLGAALEFVPDELLERMFRGYDYLHVEGYLLQCPGVVERAMEYAKGLGMTVSFDFGSVGIVRRFGEEIRGLLEQYVDIVFANEHEAEAFAGQPADKASAMLLGCMGRKGIAAVKLGAAGSIVQCGGEVHRIAAVPAEEVDSTGAGDAYAAGFLYAHSYGADTRSCGETGAQIASKVVSVVGPKILEVK